MTEWSMCLLPSISQINWQIKLTLLAHKPCETLLWFRQSHISWSFARWILVNVTSWIQLHHEVRLNACMLIFHRHGRHLPTWLCTASTEVFETDTVGSGTHLLPLIFLSFSPELSKCGKLPNAAKRHDPKHTQTQWTLREKAAKSSWTQTGFLSRLCTSTYHFVINRHHLTSS